MSISTAIAALSPQLWWKLDEGGGTTANNSGSLANDGTASGTVQWNVNGPEHGTTAVRLFSDAQIVSAGMDVASLGPYTVGLWMATDASSPTNTNWPILSIGDVTNRFARGILLYENHGTLGQPVLFGRWNPSSAASLAMPGNRTAWHWVVLTVNTGTGNARLYIDGVLGSTGNPSAATSAVSTDPLLLKSDQPVTIAHVCFWAGVLTQTQIQSVAAEVATWPQTTPANTPPPSGGGGGEFPPEESAKLDDILGYVDDLPGVVDAVNYISDTVNTISAISSGTADAVTDLTGKVDEALAHLNTLLEVTSEQVLPNIDEVKQFVSRIFISAGGLGLNSPIGGLIAHPDPNLLHESVEEYIISGQGTLSPPGALNWGNVYAVRWRTAVQPPGAGLRLGIIPAFRKRLVQWVLWWPDVGTLDLHPQVVEEFRWESFTWYWPRWAPAVIQYDVAPGFVLGVRYIMFAPTP